MILLVGNMVTLSARGRDGYGEMFPSQSNGLPGKTVMTSTAAVLSPRFEISSVGALNFKSHTDD